MAFDPISAVVNVGGELLDRLIPDPQAKDAAKLELLKLTASGDLAELDAVKAIALAQASTNTAEAGSGDKFAARWRPTIGYVCAGGFLYAVVVHPLVADLATVLRLPLTLPAIDTAVLVQTMLGMLGLGGLRTWEKIRGVAS